jgi:hypothetical protein
MHTRNLTGPRERPGTDEDYEDKRLTLSFRVSTGVQQHATGRRNRTAHHNRDMESLVCNERTAQSFLPNRLNVFSTPWLAAYLYGQQESKTSIKHPSKDKRV